MAQKRLLKKSKSPLKKRSIRKSPLKKRSIRKSPIKKSKSKKSYYNDPVGHRRSLYGDKFNKCYSSFRKLETNTPYDYTIKASKERIKYLLTHTLNKLK